MGALSLTNGRALEGQKRHPTVCNYVTIYANASIFGGNTVIGENVVIGANCIVLEPVEENKKITFQNM